MGADKSDKMYEEFTDMKKLSSVLSEVIVLIDLWVQGKMLGLLYIVK